MEKEEEKEKEKEKGGGGGEGAAGRGVKVSSCSTKRLVYFRGHARQSGGALVCQVCRHYETLSALLPSLDMECATRTLSNLYNLHTVRGVLSAAGELVSSSAMSGPHHYFGYLDPFAVHTILIDPATQLPRYYQHSEEMHEGDAGQSVPVPSSMVTRLLPEIDFTWLSGRAMAQQKKCFDEDVVSTFGLCLDDEEESVMADGGVITWKSRKASEVDTKFPNSESCSEHAKFSDSLFPYPGVLALNLGEKSTEDEADANNELHLKIIENPGQYDLSSFGAQVVDNHKPFQFERSKLTPHKHAQHKLRLITYKYGEHYVPDYLMKGNGVFIERHAFIQLITPLEESCSGFIILGREVNDDDERDDEDMYKHCDGAVTGPLELVAVPVPFGQSILIHPYSLHGDSFLTGMYAMGMTGKHRAMATADSVFLKNQKTGGNISVTAAPVTSTTQANESRMTPTCSTEEFLKSTSKKVCYILTSDVMSLAEVHAQDSQLKTKISDTIANGEYEDSDTDECDGHKAPGVVFQAYRGVRSVLWHPVVFTMKRNDVLLPSVKTLGSKLPSTTISPPDEHSEQQF